MSPEKIEEILKHKCETCGDLLTWRVIDEFEPNEEIRQYYMGQEVAVCYKCKAVVNPINRERDHAIREMARRFPGSVQVVDELKPRGPMMTKAEVAEQIQLYMEQKEKLKKQAARQARRNAKEGKKRPKK